jgi:hypothetical protein
MSTNQRSYHSKNAADARTGSRSVVVIAALAAVVLGGCLEEGSQPRPSEDYTALGGFWLTEQGRDEEEGSLGYAEWDFWYPYSMALDHEGRLLVTNIRGGFLERFVLEEDGGAVWDAYWEWPRGYDWETYPLFVARNNPAVSEILLAESLSEEGDGVFPRGRSAYAFNLPIPKPGAPDEPDHGSFEPPYSKPGWTEPLVQQYPSFYQPGDLAALDTPDNRIVITDTANSLISAYDGAGNKLAEDGGLGDQQGTFRLPLGVTANSTDEIIVADTWNHRIQVLTLEAAPDDPEDQGYDPDYNYPYVLSYQRTIGGFGYENGRFSAPYGVCVDGYDNIYVADTRNARVQKFDAAGGLLAVITGSGDWRLRAPLDVAVCDNGDLLVLDAFIWYEPWDYDFSPDDQARIIRFRRN